MSEIRPIITITHAAFDEARRNALRELVAQLHVEAPGIPFRIAEDHDRRGSLWCWREAMGAGLADPSSSHIVWLPDDAIVCRDFGAILQAAIEARPDDVFDCYVNHAGATDAKTLWYTTPDGYTGMGGVMPRALLEEHLAWRARMRIDDSVSNDGGVNLWAMHTKRLIYKTAFTLVQHDASVPSIDGNGAHEWREGAHFIDESRVSILDDLPNFLGRTYMAPEEHAPGVRSAATRLGRTYTHNVWSMLTELEPADWDLDAMYQAARGGEPVSATPHVMMVVPGYRESYEVARKCEAARERVLDDLASHGVGASLLPVDGDSLVQRMRQRAMHVFLKSTATHLLWCDLDIEPMEPTCVRRMLRSGHDVVGGACPFKHEGGRVVFNPVAGSVAAKLVAGEPVGDEALSLPHGCLEVHDVGTGFQLVSRRALYRLMQAAPSLLHWSTSESDKGEPLWALYDTGVVDGVYLSEDYMFCRLWQALGEKVYVHVPSTFRHWGTHAFEGSLAGQLGLVRA